VSKQPGCAGLCELIRLGYTGQERVRSGRANRFVTLGSSLFFEIE
jgi:hypothetical protein